MLRGLLLALALASAAGYGKITVCIHSAYLDESDCWGCGNVDPYVKVYFDSAYQGKTPTVQDSKSASWSSGNCFVTYNTMV
tara:strand:+ start:3256 stop:3498 length:243 start_codon:yes stop_codon:yes gene_type:complete